MSCALLRACGNAQLDSLEARARGVRVELVDDAFVFSDARDGSVPWKPDRVTQYFDRLRDCAGLGHVNLRSLRKFMETYGQEMGYSMTQVALRAGHNPAVAARYYSGKVADVVPGPDLRAACRPAARERTDRRPVRARTLGRLRVWWR